MDVIPKQRLPDDLKIGDWIEVYVAEIVNPHSFYIQLKKHETEFEMLMKTLE